MSIELPSVRLSLVRRRFARCKWIASGPLKSDLQFEHAVYGHILYDQLFGHMLPA